MKKVLISTVVAIFVLGAVSFASCTCTCKKNGKKTTCTCTCKCNGKNCTCKDCTCK